MALNFWHVFSPTCVRHVNLCRRCQLSLGRYFQMYTQSKACLSNGPVSSNPWSDQNVNRSSEVRVGDGLLKIQTGQLARFADGCAVAQMGDTSVMVTAVSRGRQTAASFLPLTVDYRQKGAAAGRIPTNYLRREIGRSDHEILTSRMIDRSIRPMFPEGYFVETQLVCNQLAVDGVTDPQIASINAASAALALSDIPWNGPVGAVRVGLVDGDVVINPTRRQQLVSTLNLVVTGTTGNKVVMLEGGGECVPQPNFLRAIKMGVQSTQKIVSAIRDMAEQWGKPKRVQEPLTRIGSELEETLWSMASTRIRDVFTDVSHHKISRDDAISAIKEDIVAQVLQSQGDNGENDVSEDTSRVTPRIIMECLNNITRKVFRDLILDQDRRCDGRALTDLRDINCEVDLYPPLHGSALFQRGQTQVLSTVTFDSPDSAARVDTISAITWGIKEKNFFLHYEFPPYATNETGRPGALGRRELGHGALAEKGVRPVVPADFPFTIRLTAEVLESNGSSSMASICAGSLALMDAGVPLLEAVAGVAVGLVTKTDDSTGEITDYRILTDLLGIEDYLGDMDFKMAGSKSGITAIQADVKLPGLPVGIIMEAVQAATVGKAKILSIMRRTQSVPRQDAKDSWPVLDKLQVPVAKQARFRGSGGHNLRKLTANTGVSLSPVDEATYDMFAPNQAAMDEAREMIDELLQEQREPDLEFGGIYQAKIVEIREYGVMVQLYPTMQPSLIHNSQLDQRKVNHPSALDMFVGQEITVKFFGRDPGDGRMRLSRKVLQAPTTQIIRNLGGSSKTIQTDSEEEQ